MVRAGAELEGPGERGSALTLADMREWEPAAPVDVLVSNATLQWVPVTCRCWTGSPAVLAPGGWLAAPGARQLRRALAHAARGAARRTRGGGTGWPGPRAGPVEEPGDVPGPARRPRACGSTPGRRRTCRSCPARTPVLDWMRGTGLRPVLSALPDDDERAAFEAEYGALLRQAYPRHPFGTVLPYRRIFLVGRQASQGRG